MTMISRILTMTLLLFGLTGCQHWQNLMGNFDTVEPRQSNVAVQPTPVNVLTPTPDQQMNMANMMSNESVIVFPLDANAKQPRDFPAARGVVDNTTSGGYTVFDPSVTVFALDGMSAKPDYLPEYSVPKYAQQTSVTNNVIAAMPLPNAPRPIGLSVPMQTIPNAPYKTQEGQRSGPVLTGY
jgi:hypothetical protein